MQSVSLLDEKRNEVVDRVRRQFLLLEDALERVLEAVLLESVQD